MSDNFGKSCAALREQFNITETELETKLGFPSGKISAIERGEETMSEDEAAAVSRYFGVSYDNFALGKVAPKPTRYSRFNPTEWYKLDNAAKVYPPDSSDKYSTMFRFAAVMKTKVDAQLLQQALDDVATRFPTLMVTIKRGAFWYYFERLPYKPKIVKERHYSIQPVILDGQHYLFRVVYSDYRIAVEFFHGITDGTGASIFTLTLLSRYYELKSGNKIEDFCGAKNYADLPEVKEMQDAFQEYAQNKNYAKREVVFAYIPKGQKARHGTITHFITDASELNKKAKEYGATITEYIVALLFKIFFEKRTKDGSKREVIGQVPVNLRKFFDTETLRNFSYFLNLRKQDWDNDFAGLIDFVKKGFAEQLNVKYLQENINANVRDERNKLISIVPLPLKNIGLLVAKILLGDKALSFNFSNLGRLNPPKELHDIVSRVEMIIKEPKGLGYNFSGITFGDKCVITISRSFVSSDVEKAFAKALTDEGLKVYVEANGEG